MRNGVVFTLLVVKKTYFIERNLEKEVEEEEIRNLIPLTEILFAISLVLAFFLLEMEIEHSRTSLLKKKQEKSRSPLCFTGRAKITPNAHIFKSEEEGYASDKDSTRSSSSFRFRSGFLIRKKQKVKKNSLLKHVDMKRKAEMITEGNVSMVYKLFDQEGKASMIFKPYSEENKMIEGLFLSTKRQSLNEVLAYNFDQMLPLKARAGVSETSIVKLPSTMFTESKSMRGSLQQFIPNTESCDDYGPSMFSTEDVHKIGILDLRILNCDRHSGNILFKTDEKKLFPIDHALSFPEVSFQEEMRDGTLSKDVHNEDLTLKNISYDWMLFPQAKQPFSDDLVEEIRAIDLTKQMEAMIQKGMSSKQRLAVFAATTVLKVGVVNYRKSLYDIGSIVQRTGDRKKPSILEELFLKTLSVGIDLEKLESGEEKVLTEFYEAFVSSVEDFFKL